MKDYSPQRIVCLTEETTEMLYLLGEQDRIVGISGFTVRPKQARKEKPKVSVFLTANIDEILALKPDLVIGFSDIQANIAQALIAAGVTVWVNNYRSVEGILNMMVQLGRLVNREKDALTIVQEFEGKIERIKAVVDTWPIRPKVYVEEWGDPLISGIQWVSELVEIAGGIEIFPQRAQSSLAKGRIIENPEEVIRANPDIIIGSWCGKQFKKKRVVERVGWEAITAVKNDDLYEIKSAIILQPGPAALSDGLDAIFAIVEKWVLARRHAH